MRSDLNRPYNEMVQKALRFRPTAIASDVTLIGEGQLTVALLVDGFVLRFPRSEFARTHLRHEVDVLRRMGSQLDHRVPDLVTIELDRPLPDAFVAHRFLAGSPLTTEVVHGMPKNELSHVARAVATFLRDLHSLALDDFALPHVSNAEFAQSLTAEAEHLLRPHMTEEMWARAEAELGRLAAVTTDRFAVSHTDIGGNVLYDESDASVSFIDFGSAMIGDPVLDIASLSVLGADFLAQSALTYPAISERLADAQAVRATFQLQDALYGARQGDWAYVRDVLASYS